MKGFVTFFAVLLFAATASSQIQGDFAAGVGFDLRGEEQAVFDADSIYGAIHWNGLALPGLSASTGIAIEFHPTSIAVDGSTVNVDYRVWSLNRFDCPSALYCGTDLKIGQGGEGGWVSDFDQRIVLGISIYQSDAVNVNAEFYTLEDDRPVSVAVLVRWGAGKRNQ
jgi:hypothetical protein